MIYMMMHSLEIMHKPSTPYVPLPDLFSIAYRMFICLFLHYRTCTIHLL